MVAVLRAYKWVDPHTHTHTRDTTLIESTSSSWSLQQRLTDIRAAAPDIGGTSTTSTPGISLDNALVVIVRPQQSRPRIGLTHGLDRVTQNGPMDNSSPETRYRPGAGETICSRRWQFAANQTTCVSPCMDPKIAANLRPSADGSAVRTCLVAGGG